mmetsp:Transcript_9087/g.28142  ORF Transcript_9087/g.28142 Transcript_9087/m.28142 type:complete len:245 (-) Transcript_9087:1437-2171(-)
MRYAGHDRPPIAPRLGLDDTHVSLETFALNACKPRDICPNLQGSTTLPLYHFTALRSACIHSQGSKLKAGGGAGSSPSPPPPFPPAAAAPPSDSLGSSFLAPLSSPPPTAAATSSTSSPGVSSEHTRMPDTAPFLRGMKRLPGRKDTCRSCAGTTRAGLSSCSLVASGSFLSLSLPPCFWSSPPSDSFFLTSPSTSMASACLPSFSALALAFSACSFLARAAVESTAFLVIVASFLGLSESGAG